MPPQTMPLPSRRSTAPSSSARPSRSSSRRPTRRRCARASSRSRDRYPWLVAIDDGNRITGYAYASPHRKRAAYASSVDVSVYVDETARRNGAGRALYTELFTRLAHAGTFHRAFAGIALPNDAERRVPPTLRFRTGRHLSGSRLQVRAVDRRLVVAARSMILWPRRRIDRNGRRPYVVGELADVGALRIRVECRI